MNKRSMIHLNLEFSGVLITDTYLSKRLGTCTVLFRSADMRREMTSIRLNRVSAYLNTLNPDMIRNRGNEFAADFLEAKHAEWDDLIDAYERGYGIMAKGKATSEPERKVLDFMAMRIASELGAPFEEGTADSVASC